MLIIYGFMCGNSLVYAMKAGIGGEEYVLFALSDQYFLIYCWLFYLVYITAKQAREKNVLCRMRFKTIGKYYAGVLLSRFLQLMIALGICVLIPIVVGYFLGHDCLLWNNSFSEVVRIGTDSELEVLQAYATLFHTPAEATAAAVLYLLLGSFFFSSMLFFLAEIGKTEMIIGFSVMLTGTFVGFLTDLDHGPAELLCFNNYYILHHTFQNGAGFMPAAANILAIMLLTGFLAKRAVLRNKNKLFRAGTILVTEYLFPGGIFQTVLFWCIYALCLGWVLFTNRILLHGMY